MPRATQATGAPDRRRQAGDSVRLAEPSGRAGKAFLITHHPQPNPGIANVRESGCWSLPKAVCFIRRLYSSPSFNWQPPAKGVYNVLEAGVYRGLARYAWLRMVRNQESY